jgi:hypothetical protein
MSRTTAFGLTPYEAGGDIRSKGHGIRKGLRSMLTDDASDRPPAKWSTLSL